MSKDLIKKRFKKELSEQEVEFLLGIDRFQDKLPGRVKCDLTFKNNLNGGNYRIKCLKLGHVLQGMETFVYERVTIPANDMLTFSDYVIGTTVGHVVAGDTHLKTQEVSESAPGTTPKNPVKRKDIDNVYDKLYIQFVIEKEIRGEVKEIVYNQSYEEFMRQEMLDLFAVGKKFEPEMLKFIQIHLFFDPLHNTISPNTVIDDLKLKLSIYIPQSSDHVISTDGLLL